MGASLAQRKQGMFEDLQVDPDGGARRSAVEAEATLNKWDFFLYFLSLLFLVKLFPL